MGIEDWRERIGVRVMHAMTCTHDGDDFGNGAVCVTCFDNTQRIGAIIEAEARPDRPTKRCYWCGATATGTALAGLYENGRLVSRLGGRHASCAKQHGIGYALMGDQA